MKKVDWGRKPGENRAQVVRGVPMYVRSTDLHGERRKTLRKYENDHRYDSLRVSTSLGIYISSGLLAED